MQCSNLAAEKLRILIVDDQCDSLRELSQLLRQRGYGIYGAQDGASALEMARCFQPNLILLDVTMPEMNGYEVCQRLKQMEATAEIPVIFISAVDDVLDKVRAFEVGSVDYVTKPFHAEELVIRIQHQIMLREATRQIQLLNAELEHRVHERTAELEAVNETLRREISERRRAEERLLHDALHDALTGLPNRALFMERVDNCLKYAQRYDSYQFAVLFIDLDRFKVINDSLGHLVGDQLLVAIALLLQQCMRAIDTVARLGGDEFTILLENINDESDAIRVAERIQEALKAPFSLHGNMAFTSASIGIAIGSSAYKNREELLRDADIAMYRAKDLGRSRYVIFDQKMYLRALNLLQLENDLRQAFEREELELHYQPVIALGDGSLAGFEALIRWQHPRRGFISPGEFIPLAEDTGLIVPIGEWVLFQACQQMQNWLDQFPQAQHLRLSVNLASKQLQEPHLLEMIDDVLVETGLRGESLRLELTESMLMQRTDQIIELLKDIRDRNIQISIDDFGTGYSSLSYLHRFPLNSLKIDRSFVSQMNRDAENFEIVRTIITLAHTLSMDVVAEGVETPDQYYQLRQLGCEFSQGFLFSKPVPIEAATQMIATCASWPLEPGMAPATLSPGSSATQSPVRPLMEPSLPDPQTLSFGKTA